MGNVKDGLYSKERPRAERSAEVFLSAYRWFSSREIRRSARWREGEVAIVGSLDATDAKTLLTTSSWLCSAGLSYGSMWSPANERTSRPACAPTTVFVQV